MNDPYAITIPDSVTSIGEGAFQNIRELSSVTFGNNVTKIGDRAFVGCYDLISMTFPDSLTEIGHFVFFHNNLRSINIPINLTIIGQSAFGYKLEEIRIQNKEPEKFQIDSYSFEYINFKKCILHVPKGTKEKYRSHPIFSKFMNIVEEDRI